MAAAADEPHAVPALRRFTFILAGITSAGLLLITATPLSRLWFGVVSGLSPELVALASGSLLMTLLLPGLNVIQSWFQGAMLNGRATKGISEAVGIFLLVCGLVLGAGVVIGKYPGISIGWAAFTLAMLAQTAWLWMRSQKVLSRLQARDVHQPPGNSVREYK